MDPEAALKGGQNIGYSLFRESYGICYNIKCERTKICCIVVYTQKGM